MRYIVDRIEFKSDRIVNPDDRDPEIVARYNYKGFILFSAYGVMAVVFARYLEEALELAADGEFLEAIRVDEIEDSECDRYVSLDNYCNYYDLQSYFAHTEFDIANIQEVELCPI